MRNIYYYLIIIFSIFLRFYFQFADWNFNGDEVNLGWNILNKSYLQLLNPLERGQSGPPLFLWLEKLFSFIGSPYVGLKILTFLTSSFGILLFYKIIKNSFAPSLQLILLLIFCFNPFIFSNSLTLKQYSVDLLFGLIAVQYFITTRKQFLIVFFFTLFCLFSNIGLFFSTAFGIYNFLKLFQNKNQNPLKIKTFFYSLLPYILAPIPYIIYYIWFLQQPRALDLKKYMINYWTRASVYQYHREAPCLLNCAILLSSKTHLLITFPASILSSFLERTIMPS